MEHTFDEHAIVGEFESVIEAQCTAAARQLGRNAIVP